MSGKKRPSPSAPTGEGQETANPSISSSIPPNLKQMERRKKRRALDKEKHCLSVPSETKPQKNESIDDDNDSKKSNNAPSLTNRSGFGLHLDVFRGLSSSESSVREESATALVTELKQVQRLYETEGNKTSEKNEESVQIEANKDDGLENCAPSLRYAIRRLIRGVSSSREFARQGFALAFTAVMTEISAIKLESVMKLIVDELEVSSSMKGQEAKDNLLGRLFAYGSLARSGRISSEWKLNRESSIVRDFVCALVLLASKKRYLSEPAVSIILDMAEKLPSDALVTQILDAPGVREWLERAYQTGDPDSLLFALRLNARIGTSEIGTGTDLFGQLLPCPFSAEKFFSRDHLSLISPCFKESTFCLPRVHSLWPVVINLLLPETPPLPEGSMAEGHSSKKNPKKVKKANLTEDPLNVNLRNFCEIIIENSLLLSSHDRKSLALNVISSILPKLPVSGLQTVLSSKIVYCLMDILSNKSSWLYNAGHHFLTETVKFVSETDERQVTAVISLQRHSGGKFDSITKTTTVKQLISGFNTWPGCLFFVHSLINLFIDEVGPASDEPSDQSQTTDENSDDNGNTNNISNINNSNVNGNNNNMEVVKSWVVDTMPRVMKNLKVTPEKLKDMTDEEIVRFSEEKFKVQVEIMKFLSVQGMFNASLGNEVTSFELQEKFKWPKIAVSDSLRRACIEQLQVLLEDAQKMEASGVSSGLESSDLGSYFARFVKTVCNIPSVLLYRSLSDDDEKAFKKILSMESTLYQKLQERKGSNSVSANRLHSMRYLLIQLLLQILLRPGEFSEAATDLVICCKKAFSLCTVGNGEDPSDDDEELDDKGGPLFMDVLVDTFLSLLPHSSGRTCFAVEQVFRAFCEEITDTGLLRMLRIVKKEINPRHQIAPEDEESDEESDDDFIAIEDEPADVADGADVAMGSTGDSSDVSEGGVADQQEEEEEDEEIDEEDNNDKNKNRNKNTKNNKEKDDDNNNSNTNNSDSDDSDGMDDDAMFRIDAYLATMFKERKISGSEGAMAQFLPFKFRVLSLVEIYLHKNPGKSQVLTVYSVLMQSYVKSHANTGGEQFKQRVGGILQKKIFKSKEYPKEDKIQLSTLKTLIEKSLKLVSRTRFKTVSSVAQNATFWLVKLVTAKNPPKSELEGIIETFKSILNDYFTNKKSRLKLGFIKEVVKRYGWVGPPLFGFLVEKSGGARSEFRKIETLDLLEAVMKQLVVPNNNNNTNTSEYSKLVKKQLPAICKLIGDLMKNLPEKQSRRSELRRFCTRVLSTVSGLNLTKYFVKALKPDVFSLCQAQLGSAFAPFSGASSDE